MEWDGSVVEAMWSVAEAMWWVGYYSENNASLWSIFQVRLKCQDRAECGNYLMVGLSMREEESLPS